MSRTWYFVTHFALGFHSVFGIGLDDAFVIMSAYGRTDSNSSPVERIRAAMSEASISICMTTVTSASAFALGCTSSIPAVRWL